MYIWQAYRSRGAGAAVMLDGRGAAGRLRVGIGLLMQYGRRELFYVQVAVRFQVALGALLFQHDFSSGAEYLVIDL